MVNSIGGWSRLIKLSYRGAPLHALYYRFPVFVPTVLLNTFLRAFVWGIDGAEVGSSGPKKLVPTPNKIHIQMTIV